MLNLTCPNCQSQVTFADVPPGTPVRCRACKHSFFTPARDGGDAAPLSALFGAAAEASSAEPAPSPAAPAPAPAPAAAGPALPAMAPPNPEAPRRKSAYEGPLIAETGETCPQCGLTTVKPVRSSGSLCVGHAIGLVLCAACILIIREPIGWIIGGIAWILASVIVRAGFGTTVGKVCSTCGNRWE